MQWIPSHVNIRGNERADLLAKEATRLPQRNTATPLSSIRVQIDTILRLHARDRLLESSESKKWATLLTDGPINRTLPRQTGVALFRLTTGHDYLAAHLNRIHVLPSPECLLCGYGSMTSEHLTACPALDHSLLDESEEGRLSRLYWSARRQMAQLPRAGVG